MTDSFDINEDDFLKRINCTKDAKMVMIFTSNSIEKYLRLCTRHGCFATKASWFYEEASKRLGELK